MTEAQSRSTLLSVSTAASTTTPSLASLVRSHPAATHGPSNDGTAAPSPSNPSLHEQHSPVVANPLASSPLSSLLQDYQPATMKQDLHYSDSISEAAVGQHVPPSDHKGLSLSQLAQLHHPINAIPQEHSVSLLGNTLGEMTLLQGEDIHDNSSFVMSGSSKVRSQPSLHLAYSSLSNVTLLVEDPQKQKRLFALVMCRTHVQTSKPLPKLRRKILKQLAQEFDSKRQFDFSTPSPDDTVRDKQKKGFRRNPGR